jgi:hypothetical protein
MTFAGCGQQATVTPPAAPAATANDVTKLLALGAGVNGTTLEGSVEAEFLALPKDMQARLIRITEIDHGVRSCP